MTGGHRFSVYLLLILFAAGSNSQEDEPGWYEVELLVFQYTGEPAADREIFPLLPELRFPRELRHLRRVDGNIEWEQTWQLRRGEELIPTPPGPGREPPPAAPRLPIFKPENDRELSTPELDSDRGLAAPELDYSVPAAFALLPASQRKYNSERRRIGRLGDTEVLFHQAWRQPVPSRRRAVPILIQSDTDTDYPALQGSLLLYAARYLHVETNLWLNYTRTDLPTGWTMPRPPLPPAPEPLGDFRFQVVLVDGFAKIAQGQDEAVESPVQDSPDLTQLAPPPGADGRGPEHQEILVNIEEWLAQPAYLPFNHAVALRQQRRMRSSELHYLDHPHLGVVISLSPYEFNPFLPPPAAE
ncbi:MAG: CsiV family protein [Halieaceae bacterium]|nr:CsiV family protein [Halieaceae bacterium]